MSRDQRSASKASGASGLTDKARLTAHPCFYTHSHSQKKRNIKRGKKEAVHNSAGIAVHHQLQA